MSGKVFVVAVNGKEQLDQYGNDDEHHPSAFTEFGDRKDHHDNACTKSAKAINHHFGAPAFVAFCTGDRKSTRLNSSHSQISYAVFCLKKKKKITHIYITL